MRHSIQPRAWQQISCLRSISGLTLIGSRSQGLDKTLDSSLGKLKLILWSEEEGLQLYERHYTPARTESSKRLTEEYSLEESYMKNTLSGIANSPATNTNLSSQNEETRRKKAKEKNWNIPWNNQIYIANKHRTAAFKRIKLKRPSLD